MSNYKYKFGDKVITRDSTDYPEAKRNRKIGRVGGFSYCNGNSYLVLLDDKIVLESGSTFDIIEVVEEKLEHCTNAEDFILNN